MANAKCCDICGKFYKELEGFAITIARAQKDRGFGGNVCYGRSTVFELCDECSDKVLKSLGKKKGDIRWE